MTERSGSSEPTLRSAPEAGPTAEAGPLGPVDTAKPAASGPVTRPTTGAATFTVIVGFAALLVSLLVLGSIAEGVRAHQTFAIDTFATYRLHALATPGLNVVMNILTDIGSSLVIPPLFVIVLAWLLWTRRFGSALFLGVACGGSLAIDETMKLYFQRPRPGVPWAPLLTDYSFPSGHTMNAVAFYIALALVLWSVFGHRIGAVSMAVAVTLALGVGVSRIYLGYHFFTDVVGGILAGSSWLIVAGAAFRARPTWRRWRTSGSSPAAGRDVPGAGPIE